MKANGTLDSINSSMVQGTLGVSGFDDVIYRNLYQVPTVSDEERHKMLDEIEKMMPGI